MLLWGWYVSHYKYSKRKQTCWDVITRTFGYGLGLWWMKAHHSDWKKQEYTLVIWLELGGKECVIVHFKTQVVSRPQHLLTWCSDHLGAV